MAGGRSGGIRSEGLGVIPTPEQARQPNDSAVTVKLPQWLHDAVCVRAIHENGGNVSELIRDTLRALVLADAGPSR